MQAEMTTHPLIILENSKRNENDSLPLLKPKLSESHMNL